MPRSVTTRTREMPVSSCTSRRATPSGVSPSSMVPIDFVRLPGRVHGSTPLEQMVPLQRAINRGWKQILEHRDLSTNPIFLVDGQSGLQHQTLTLDRKSTRLNSSHHSISYAVF